MNGNEVMRTDAADEVERLVLWHVPQARSFRVLWMLEELGLDYELRHLSFFDKSLRSPPFSKVNPFGRVPALEIGQRVMTESLAILEWLVETHPAAGLWRAPGAPERMAWLERLHFAESVGQHLAILTQQHIALREDHMRSPVVMKLEAKRLEKALGVLEAALADGREWLLEGGFSAVDIANHYGVWIARRFVSLAPFEHLLGWDARCMARPAFRRALEKDGQAEIYTREFYPVPEEK